MFFKNISLDLGQMIENLNLRIFSLIRLQTKIRKSYHKVCFYWPVQSLLFYRSYVCACVCSVMSASVRPHELQPARLLCSWDSPGKNTGVGCRFLIQGFFPTQGSNSHLFCLLHFGQTNSLPLCHLGNPMKLKYAYSLEGKLWPT